MKRSKEEDEKKSKQEKMEKRREGFLHSWFMYSKTLFRYEDIQADPSRHDKFQNGLRTSVL